MGDDSFLKYEENNFFGCFIGFVKHCGAVPGRN